MEHLQKPIKITSYQKYKLIISSVLGALALIILYNYSTNGRYVLREETMIILDTRTGTIYAPKNKTYLELDEFTEME